MIFTFRERGIKGKTHKVLILSALFLTLFLFFISLTSAAPPFISSPVTTNGISVEHPIVSPIKANTDHEFHFHIFNVTTGFPIGVGTTLSCSFHLYNSSGWHIYENNNVSLHDDVYDIVQLVKGGNFTTPDQYSFLFQCNNSNQGGFYGNDFVVTSTGFDNSFWFIILGTALAILFLIFSIVTPEEFFVYISGLFFLIIGIYIMINGFSITNDVNTRMIAFIYIGIGILFTVGAYIFNLWYDDKNENEEDED